MGVLADDKEKVNAKFMLDRASIHGTTHLAQKFRAYPDVFGDLRLRDALGDLRVFFNERKITLLRRVGDGGMPPALQTGKIALQKKAEKTFEFRHTVEQLAFGAVVQQQ